MTADTAKLLASLDLQDQMSPKLKGAVGNVANAESAIGSLGTRLTGLASNLRGGVSNAIGTFTGRIKQGITYGLGVLGVGGVLSFGDAIHEALGRVQDFGGAVINLIAATRETPQIASNIVALFEHFGISAGDAVTIAARATKNLESLGGTAKKAAAFQKTFGLSLTDSKGRLVDFNTLLLRSADYFVKNGDVTQRNAALAKIFGKNWAELIPAFKGGAQGMADVEAEAQRLGLTLTADNIAAIEKSKDATREWNTALGGLELQIGVNLLPEITKLATAATQFVENHRGDIVQFFKNAVAFGEGAVTTIGSVAGALSDAWSKVPDPVRKLLTTALVGDRVVKFAFGFSPISIAVKFGEEALGAVVGAVGKSIGGSLIAAGIGKAFVQPVFVTNPGFGAGGLGGAAEDVGAVGAGVGLGTLALGGIGIVGDVALVADELSRLPGQLQSAFNTSDQLRSGNVAGAVASAGDLFGSYHDLPVLGQIGDAFKSALGVFFPTLSTTQTTATDNDKNLYNIAAAAKATSANITKGFAGANSREDRTNSLLGQVKGAIGHQKPPQVNVLIPIRIVGQQVYRITATTFATASGQVAPLGVRQKT